MKEDDVIKALTECIHLKHEIKLIKLPMEMFEKVKTTRFKDNFRYSIST